MNRHWWRERSRLPSQMSESWRVTRSHANKARVRTTTAHHSNQPTKLNKLLLLTCGFLEFIQHKIQTWAHSEDLNHYEQLNTRHGGSPRSGLRRPRAPRWSAAARYRWSPERGRRRWAWRRDSRRAGSPRGPAPWRIPVEHQSGFTIPVRKKFRFPAINTKFQKYRKYRFKFK